MAISRLNMLTISGNLGADIECRTIELRDGTTSEVASTTLYTQHLRNLDESFTVRLSIWPSSHAWRRLDRLTKGSLVVAMGPVEPRPYLSPADNAPRAGLQMTCDRIEVIRSKHEDDDDAIALEAESPAEVSEDSEAPEAEPESATA